MIKKFLITLIAVILTLVAVILFPACNLFGGKTYKQNLDYSESIERINNPDQGFYRPIYVSVKEDGASYNKNIVMNSAQLYHLRSDISDFSKAVNGQADKPLTDKALKDLGGLLSYLNQKEKNAVVRFAYDPSYTGAKDK